MSGADAFCKIPATTLARAGGLGVVYRSSLASKTIVAKTKGPSQCVQTPKGTKHGDDQNQEQQRGAG